MKKYIESFELIKKFHDLKPYKIKFKEGLNIVVGENGSGKSTLLQLLSEHKDFKDIIKIKLVDPNLKVKTKFFDTEKMNPRLKKDLNSSKNIMYDVCSHFWSHGESIIPLIEACREFKDEVIFIDEPEAGVSLSNQLKMLKIFKQCEKNNCQLIVTTHSYPIIKNVEKVISLDSKKWIKSETFLKKMLNETR